MTSTPALTGHLADAVGLLEVHARQVSAAALSLRLPEPCTLQAPGATYGAALLASIATDLADAARETGEAPSERATGEAASAAIPVGEHARFRALTDLAAYRVDLEGLASESGAVSLSDLAFLALSEVARAVADSIRADLAEAEQADAEEAAYGDVDAFAALEGEGDR